MKKIPSLFIAIAICYAVEFTASAFTQQSVSTWYVNLDKPLWTPPNLAFPIVWTILYTLMGVSLWLVWQKTQKISVFLPFAVQLALNFFWSLFFFGWQSPLLGLIDILALIAAIVWSIRTFDPYSKTAARLLIPYLAWVVYASSLNAYIWWYNVYPSA